jgi:hypothetical protein
MKKINLYISKYKNIIFFFLLVFFLISLYDLYFVKYGRVFDLVGIFFFFLYVLIYQQFPNKISNNEFFIILGILFLFFFLPLQLKNFLTHGVVFIGFVIFIIARRLNTDILRICLKNLIIILIIFQVVDYISHKLFDIALFAFDESIITKNLRGYYTNYFRPAGFFTETNAFASLLVLLYLSQIKGNQLPSLKLSVIIILSLFLSNSMFAAGMGFIILFITLFKSQIHLFLKIFILTFLIILFFIFSTDVLIYRFENFMQEGSLHVRLNLTNYHKFDYLSLIFPSGFHHLDESLMSNKDQLFGINGFSFIFDGLGLFAIFFYFFMFKKLKFIPSLLFLLLNITYHIYLHFLFYFVMAVLLPKNSYKNLTAIKKHDD